MRGWRIAGGAPVPVALPASAPGPDHVVVAVEAAWLPRAAGDSPAVAGGAAVGVVTETGEHASGLRGRRVLVAAHDACGECEVCRRGGAAACPHGGARGGDLPGTLAEHAVVPARSVVALDGDLAVPGPAAAALAGEVAIAYAMYVRGNIGPREPAVIVGDDACARFLAQILVAKGVTPATGDEAPAGDRPLRVFSTDPSGRDQAVERCGPRATLVVRAAQGLPLVVPAALLAREVAIVAVAGAHPDLLTEIAALAVRGEVRLDASAVDVVPLDEVAAALAGPADRALVVAIPR